jgi:hypothetical protein
MIRKWPYLTSTYKSRLIDIRVDPAATWFKGKASVYNFKVFRMTTRFKKYNRKPLTLIIRKKDARRKRKTNWFRLLYITRSWVFFYLRSRQFVRFYQSLGVFNSQSYSTTPIVVVLQCPEAVSDRGFNTFSCSRSLLKTFLEKAAANTHHQKTTDKYYLSPLSHSRSEGILARTASDLVLVENMNPGVIDHDNLLYPYNTELDALETSATLYMAVIDSMFNSTLRYVTLIHNMLILLTLRNL